MMIAVMAWHANSVAAAQEPQEQRQPVDLASGRGGVFASRKIQCSLEDAKPIVYWWQGHAFSRVPGERDRRLFAVEGMNIRQCGTVEDPERGTGFRLVSREILFYKDPASGQMLREWDNPWTGKTVKVLHVANDPVNGRPQFPRGPNGEELPFSGQISGGTWWWTITVPLFYTSPLGGDFQEFIGGNYHATEMFNFFGEVADLLDRDKDTADVRVGWVRLSKWLPWMEMGDRVGLMYFHTAGRKLESFDALPETMRKEIAENYPEWTAPPPLDDTRPNMTSWIQFKRHVDAIRSGE
jgi:hypothetical protein